MSRFSNRIRGSFAAADLAVYAIILIFGGMEFFYYFQPPNLLNDAIYLEIARSLLEKGVYQFDFRPETLFPPGFPVLVALVCRFTGYSQAALYHLMAISTTLGLAAAYELLRRLEGRAMAAACCLLLASCPSLFGFSTQLIFSDMPYFFASMLVLLLALKLQRAEGLGARMAWMAGFAAALASAVMIRSVGVTLLMGLAAWMAVSFFWSLDLGRRRVALFLAPLLLASGLQLLWSSWAGQRKTAEWPLAGYPQSYLSQLSVKNGNYPELGAATWRDIPARVRDNLDTRASKLVIMMSRLPWVNPHWSSPAVFGVLALILIGLASSLWQQGGQLHDWYFAGYELLYALWPWNFEARFLLPVVPLACLYFWRGGKQAIGLLARRPRLAGACLAALGPLLAFDSLQWFFEEKALQLTARFWFIGRKTAQPFASTGFWILMTLVGLALVFDAGAALSGWLARLRAAAETRPVRVAALLALAGVVAAGAVLQMDIARRNVAPEVTKSPYYPDIEAARWIRSNLPPETVVMARKQDLVFHYSQHRVVWSPPLTNPQVLLEGIRKYHVAALVVVDREDYWQPDDATVFQSLERAAGPILRLLHSGPHYRVFAIEGGRQT